MDHKQGTDRNQVFMFCLESAIANDAFRVHQNPDYYRQGQQITEHMFGTLKRQRGFTFTLMLGKEKVLGEVGYQACFKPF